MQYYSIHDYQGTKYFAKMQFQSSAKCSKSKTDTQLPGRKKKAAPTALVTDDTYIDLEKRHICSIPRVLRLAPPGIEDVKMFRIAPLPVQSKKEEPVCWYIAASPKLAQMAKFDQNRQLLALSNVLRVKSPRQRIA